MFKSTVKYMIYAHLWLHIAEVYWKEKMIQNKQSRLHIYMRQNRIIRNVTHEPWSETELEFRWYLSLLAGCMVHSLGCCRISLPRNTSWCSFARMSIRSGCQMIWMVSMMWSLSDGSKLSLVAIHDLTSGPYPSQSIWYCIWFPLLLNPGSPRLHRL